MAEVRKALAGLFFSGALALGVDGQASPQLPTGMVPRASEATSPARALLDKAGTQPFAPPSDGRLSAAQVDLYLAVEARAGEIRKALAAGPGDDEAFGRSSLAEVTAAAELGIDPGELEWVHDRVLEAHMAEMTLALLRETEAGRQEFLASLLSERHKESDPARVEELDRRIHELRIAAAESQAALTPAIRANIETLASHQDELDRYASTSSLPPDPPAASPAGASEEPALVRIPR